MTHVTLIGPVELADSEAFIAVALAPDGRVASAVEQTAATALAKLAAGSGASQLQLDERHASHAKGLGLATGPAPEPLRRVAAELLVQFANQGSLTKLTDPELYGALLEAIRAFSASEPWRYFDSDVAVPCSATGSLGGKLELSILGSGGLQRGLATYSKPGLYARMADASEREREALRDELDSLVLLLEPEPPALVETLELGLGLSHVPLLNHFAGGRSHQLRPDEVRLLIATLRAVVAVISSGAAATGELVWRGKRVEVRVDPGEGFDPAGGLVAPLRKAARSPAHDLDERVVQELLAFARTQLPGFTDAWLAEGVLAGEPGLARPLSLHVRPFAGKTLAHRARDAGVLDPEALAWVAAQDGALLSLFEVETTDGEGGHLQLRELFTGERHLLHDLSLAALALPRQCFLGRLVAFGGETLLVGSQLRPLAPLRAATLRDAFLEAEGVAALPAARLRDPAVGLRLVEAVLRPRPGQAEQAGQTGQAEQAGGLRNTDGDPVRFTEDRYECSGSHEQLKAALLALPGVLLGESSKAEAQFTWTRAGNAFNPSWRRTDLGSFALSRSGLTITTGSVARADLARALVEAALVPPPRFLERKALPLDLPALPEGGAVVDAQPIPEGPWLPLLPELEQAAVFTAELLAGSVHGQPDAAALASVHLRLCEDELLSRAPRPADHLDPGRTPLDLRRLLGLAADGTFLGPDPWYGPLGAGVPLSLALPSLYAPLLCELSGPDRVRDAVALTAKLWNLTRERPVSPAAVDELAASLRGPDAAALRAAAPWLAEQCVRLFGHDRRVVEKWELTGRGARGHLQAMWSLPPALTAAGLAAGGVPRAPLGSYDAEAEPDPVLWSLTPAAWRRELVAAAHRKEHAPFGGDLDAHAARHVELEDALLANKPAVVLEAMDELEEALGSRHEALDLLALALARDPEVKLTGRPTKRLKELLAAMLEEVLEADPGGPAGRR